MKNTEHKISEVDLYILDKYGFQKISTNYYRCILFDRIARIYVKEHIFDLSIFSSDYEIELNFISIPIDEMDFIIKDNLNKKF
jgi:hypothetical protein